MPRRQATSAFVCLLAIAALAVGCGGGSGSSISTAGTAASKPAPPKSDFPKTEGKTLGEIVKAADSHTELVVSPAALAFYKGVNRYPFGVFHPDRSQVDDAEVALYVARVPPAVPGGAAAAKNGKDKKGAVARARTKALGQPALGPYPAAIESLATKPAYRAQTTTNDPDAATSVYTTNIDFPSKREWRVGAPIKKSDEPPPPPPSPAPGGGFKPVPPAGPEATGVPTPPPAAVA